MKIRPMGAELFHVAGRADRHDEASSRFPQFCVRAQKLHRSLGISLIVIFTRATRKPAHNNGCGLLPEKAGLPLISAFTSMKTNGNS
jgi:hypothetical protein